MTRIPHLVFIDDNPFDLELALHVTGQLDFPVIVTQFSDPQQAINYLRRQGEHTDRPEVHLVLLDIHMPGLNGFDVLHELRADPTLQGLPIVMHSTSTLTLDQQRSQSSGASGYVTKSGDLARMRASMHDSITTLIPAA